MADFAYTTVPGKIKTLLGKIREVGVPPKVTVQWLKTIGFTSSNDPSLVGVLKQVGLIDQGNVPTPIWTEYRGAKHKKVLGDAIREGYSELFTVYPDAERRSQDDLEHVFSTSSTGGKQVISKLVSTFKSLVEQAEFTPTDLELPTGPLHVPAAQAPPPPNQTRAEPSVHIDIQVHISPEASPEQIDKVFAAMAKHIYGAESD
jgi:hypothetical protein